jgi:hypothetical protein
VGSGEDASLPVPRPSPFSPCARALIPTSYHRLAKILLDEGVADHDQAYALTKMMLQIAQREKMWEDDRCACGQGNWLVEIMTWERLSSTGLSCIQNVELFRPDW